MTWFAFRHQQKKHQNEEKKKRIKDERANELAGNVSVVIRGFRLALMQRGRFNAT